jgi:hypothetical protein
MALGLSAGPDPSLSLTERPNRRGLVPAVLMR